MKKILVYLLACIISVYPVLVFAGAAEKIDTPSTPNSGGVTNTGGGGKSANDGSYNLPTKSANDDYFPKRRPTAASVANVLKTGGHLALAQAMSELIGAGVDYILDPANNRVVYHDTKGNYCNNEVKVCVDSLEEAKDSFLKWYNDGSTSKRVAEDVKCFYESYYIRCLWRFEDESEFGRSVLYHPKKRPNSKSLEEVAQKVLENADKGHQPSVDVANEAIKRENPSTDPATNPSTNPATNPSTNPTTDPATNPNTNPATDPNKNKDKDNETKPFELPAFCEWASIVCSTAEKISILPDTLKSWVSDLKEWFKEFVKPKDEKTEIDIEVSDNNKPGTDIRFNAMCPAPVALVNFNFFGSHIYYEFTYDRFCQMLQDLRFIVISIGGFIAVMIVGGVRTKDE